MKKKLLIWVGGGRCTGKTTVMENMKVSPGYECKDIKVEDLLTNIANEQYRNIKTCELETKDWKKWEKMWIDVLIDIMNNDKSNRLFYVETHYGVNSPDGYKPGFNSYDIERISKETNCLQLGIHLYLDPRVNLERRIKDNSSPDRKKNLDNITVESLYNHYYFKKFSRILDNIDERNITIEIDNIYLDETLRDVKNSLDIMKAYL